MGCHIGFVCAFDVGWDGRMNVDYFGRHPIVSYFYDALDDVFFFRNVMGDAKDLALFEVVEAVYYTPVEVGCEGREEIVSLGEVEKGRLIVVGCVDAY